MKTTILIIFLYLYLKPNLDKTRQGEVLLWFWNWRRDKRKYIKL